MLKSVMSFGKSGLQEWLLQRITAVILAGYMLFLLGYFMLHSSMEYSTWHTLFLNKWMRLGSFAALLSLIIHAWIGVWTIITDYLKPIYLRFFAQLTTLFLLVLYLVWGIQILWRIY